MCLFTLNKRTANNLSSEEPIILYCAAGLRHPMAKIIDQYTRETGRNVTIIYNGSGALLSQMQLAPGDLYFPANDSYIKDAKNLGLTTGKGLSVIFLTAKIIVHKDNVKIKNIDDLTRPGTRISLANQSAAIGKFTQEILSENGLLKRLKSNIIVTKPTVNAIIQDVSMGSADATIAWGSLAEKFPELRTLSVPIFCKKKSAASITVLQSSANKSNAIHLARYISASDKGLKIFKDAGFEIAKNSHKWSDSLD